MNLIRTEEPNIVRDKTSKALLFSNNLSREEYRAKISEKKVMQSELNNLKCNIEGLHNEICEMKDMILSILKGIPNVNNSQ
jgi:seryl-tRNA synthetase